MPRGNDNATGGSAHRLRSILAMATILGLGSILPAHGAVIGDFVWQDLDADGVQDATESGLAGVTVSLYPAGETSPALTTVTNGSGIYSFAVVPSESYEIGFTPPSGYYVSPFQQGGNPGIDSDANPNVVGLRSNVVALSDADTVIDDIDAGFFLPDASLGDFVWNDLNANGIQDAGEPGISGVTVSLRSAGGVVTTAVTDADGAFSFLALPPGDYAMQFDVGGTFLVPTVFQQGPNPALDSDVRRVGAVLTTDFVTLTGVESNLTIDAGFYRPNGELGDFVWNDLNGNGIQDLGEPGISGVTVSLLDAFDSLINTTTTAGNGSFSFPGLLTGQYALQFQGLPAGLEPTRYEQGVDPMADSNVFADGGIFRTALIAISGVEQNLTVDAGFASRQTVPVPAPVSLLAFGVIVTGFQRRKRRSGSMEEFEVARLYGCQVPFGSARALVQSV